MIVLHIEKKKEALIWLLGVIIFIVSRFLIAELSAEGVVIGLVLLGASLYWLIVPFILGRPIYGPTNAADKLIKGKDDFLRFLLFLAGVFMFTCSLFTK
jgi:hypothetical protein